MNVRFRELFAHLLRLCLERTSMSTLISKKTLLVTLSCSVQKSIPTQLSEKEQEQMKDPNLIQRVNVKRSTVPAVTHVDMSARVQTVDETKTGDITDWIKKVLAEKDGLVSSSTPALT